MNKKFKEVLKLKDSETTVLFLITFIVGWVAFQFFSRNGLVFANFDALSRLNIARKMVDNLTPGLAQLGNVWLPLPQLVMLPMIWFTPWWHSSIAGSVPSVIAYGISSVYLYKLMRFVTYKKWARLMALAAYVLNPNMLLLQSMAMSETLFVMLMVGATYYLIRWARENTTQSLLLAGLFTFFLTLVRYEGYAFLMAAIGYVSLVSWVKEHGSRTAVEGKTIFFLVLASFGVVIWSLYLGAIFGDPLYWQKIYSHQKSIISTDTQLELLTFTDQGSKLAGNEGNLWLSLWSYWQAVAYMSGIGLAILSSILAPIFLIMKRAWRRVDVLGFGLLLTSFVFIVFTLSRGGIPISLPQLGWERLFETGLSHEFEYNMRYGLLTLPAVVVLLAWSLSWNKVSFLLGSLFIGAHVLSPMQNQVNLYYQLAINWETGSATSKSEDQAVEWFKKNYTDGLVMMSALKHDPSMFRLGIDYKNFIHEGTGEYWLESRVEPQKHAVWIYMNNLNDLRGGLTGEEDSVGKYLVTFNAWREYYTLRYQDEDIVIYQRTLDYLAENSRLKQDVEDEYLKFKSIDIMQWSRDRFREWQDSGQPTREQIKAVVKAAKSMNPTHIAIGTPYDKEFNEYLKIWVEEIRKQGLKVWFRGNFAGWEGWYDYPVDVTEEKHLVMTKEFILKNGSLFEDGDSFTSCPECENGAGGDPRFTGNYGQHNAFLQAQQQVMKEAFKTINKRVFTNWQSMNGDIALQILDPVTVESLGGVITLDHYVSPQRMDRDLSVLADKFPGAKVFIGEYGAELVAHGSVEQQEEILQQMFEVLDKHKDQVIGFNYWSINRSSTALIDDEFQVNLAGKFLAKKYGFETVEGRVVNDKGNPLANVAIHTLHDQVSSDSDGAFQIKSKINDAILFVSSGCFRKYVVLDNIPSKNDWVVELQEK